MDVLRLCVASSQLAAVIVVREVFRAVGVALVFSRLTRVAVLMAAFFFFF